MSDLPGPVQTRLQSVLGDQERIVAGTTASMFYTPVVATVGTLLAVAVGVATPLGIAAAAIFWIPTLTLVVTLYPHVTVGVSPPIKAFPGGALLLVVTDERLLMFRYGVARVGTTPIFESRRDGSVHVSACDVVGPGAGLIVASPGGELKVASWRIKHLADYVREANRVLD
ncbi:MAG: hypothetical protein ACC652_01765 [Acidimicrobiales bacterium]